MILFEICDDILKWCLKNQNTIDLSEFSKPYLKPGVPLHDIESALRYLTNCFPPYLVKRLNADIYDMSPDGEIFAQDGGFLGKSQNNEKERKTRQEDYEFAKEVNRSVLANNQFQKWATIGTIIVAIAAVAVSWFSNANVREQNSQLSILQQRMERVEKTQAKIDSLANQMMIQSSPNRFQKKHP
jgi:hypothetical protein